MSHMTLDRLKAMIEGETSSTTLYKAQGTAPRPSNGFRPASPGSVKFLRDLVAERAPDTDPAYVESIIAEGQKRVSKAIDNLKARPVVADKPTERTNRYPGTCDRCETRVEAEEGLIEKADDGHWVVYHRDGECPATEFPFPFGRYAVDTDEGHLAFYVVNTRGLFVQASDELHRVRANAQAKVIEKIAADPLEASKRYGQELGSCGVCGRILTDEESRMLGIGPVCRAKWAG